MKYILLIFCIAIFFYCTSSKNLSTANQQSNGDLLIENINIVDVENDKLIREKDILIRDKRISEIISHAEKKLTAPVVVNGKDKYLIPGLWDMHTHPFSTIYEWQAVLANDEYKDILIESLQFLANNKITELNAFVIMSNYIHLTCLPAGRYGNP
jgi:predicted amidohydrolase YtcJ